LLLSLDFCYGENNRILNKLNELKARELPLEHKLFNSDKTGEIIENKYSALYISKKNLKGQAMKKIKDQILNSENEISGISLSNGFAKGKAFIYKDILHKKFSIVDLEENEVDDEYLKLKTAISEVIEDLKESKKRTEKHTNSEIGQIFEAQEMMLQDSSLNKELKNEIYKELNSSKQAVKNVFKRWIKKFKKSKNKLIKEKADDLEDLSKILLRNLVGVKSHILESAPANSIIVAKKLLPSDTIFLNRKSVAGVIVESGGTSSHTALLTRELGIPAVTGVKNALELINRDDLLLVFGNEGKVILNPTEKQNGLYEKILIKHNNNLRELIKLATEKAVTIDNHPINVMANIADKNDSYAAIKHGADGIGLYRIEGLYLTKRMLPKEEELYNEIKGVLSSLNDHKISIRLLDIGGDKNLSYLDLPEETSPFLGRRGIRLLFAFPELLELQIRVILRIAKLRNISILVPMITLPEDMKKVQMIIRKIANEMEISSLPLIGAMIETPASALCVDDISEYCDFFSIGTNDLTQYTMAAGRESEYASEYFIDNHKAIMKLIKLVVENKKKLPVAICGELAGKIEYLSELLKIGIRNISVPPGLIPEIKAKIRTLKITN
jgi:phosphoenolpyruvate-protein phosphotransferase